MKNTYREKPKQVFCKNCKHLEWFFITDSTSVPGNCLVSEDYIDPIYGPKRRLVLASAKNKNFDCNTYTEKTQPTPEEIEKNQKDVEKFVAIMISLFLAFFFTLIYLLYRW